MKRLVLLTASLWLCGLALYAAGVTISPGALPQGLLGKAYSQTLTASGGYPAGTYTFALAAGALPNGITLSAGGVLSGTPTAVGLFDFTAQATSSLPGSIPVVGTQDYSIAIYAAPAITPASLNAGVVGTPYSETFSGTGGYTTGTYSFALVSGALPSGITLSANGALSGTPTAAGTATFALQVTSIGTSPNVPPPPLLATQAFTIAIYPVLAIATTAASSGTVGTPYSQTFAATGGTGTYTWTATASTLPPGLTFSAAGGLSGTPTTAGTYPLAVQVSSSVPTFGTLTASGTFSVAIATTATFAITGSLGNGVVGTPYSAKLDATGGYGAGTYTFAVLSGSVPAGTTLSAGGALSGTPTAAGTFVFTVQATSTNSNPGAYFPPLTATEAFTVTIYPALAITTTVASSGTVGTAYSQSFGASGGAGGSSYTWSVLSGTPPPGLALSAAGVLSGTPTAAGAFAFTLQVSSVIPSFVTQQASAAFNVVIAPGAALAITGSLGGGVVGTPYSATLGATGGYGAGTYTFAVLLGAAPTGTTLSAGGALSGTPAAAGSFTFTAQVTSTFPKLSAGLTPQTATAAFTVVIYPALAITTTAASSGTIGATYSQTFAASGGAGASSYTWSVPSGTAPPGLTLSAAGVLSGTPTTAGTFAFTVQVASANTSPTASIPALTATRAFTVVIYPALAITPQTLSPATVGTAYVVSFQPTGGYGSGSYSYALTAGALPPGILLVSGTLSGTPTAAGTFTFTVQLINAQVAGASDLPAFTATQSFTIVVSLPAAPPVTISGLPASPAPATQPVLGLSVGTAYPLDIQGTITLTFAPTSGPDDPNVQFTTGGRTVTFQIPAGSTQAQFAGNTPGVQTGTVAGTITLILNLTAARTDITPTPAPRQVLVVAPSAPVITSAVVTPVSGGFNLVVIGYATTRDMTSAAIVFTPAAGVTLTSTTASVSMSPLFTTWYQNATSAQFGSQFSLAIPFTVQSATAPITSLAITLTNSQGSSAPATAAY